MRDLGELRQMVRDRVIGGVVSGPVEPVGEGDLGLDACFKARHVAGGLDEAGRRQLLRCVIDDVYWSEEEVDRIVALGGDDLIDHLVAALMNYNHPRTI